MSKPSAVARVVPKTNRLKQLEFWTFVVASLVALLGATLAQADEKVISSYGVSTFGELKYSADFEHLDYVNPDAPKGGEMSLAVVGSFDSMNPYSRKGTGGALSTIMYESLLAGTADEIGSSYGLLAERLEYPEDKSWVVFHMRPEAKFSDGTPVTAEDVFFVYNLFLKEGLTSYRTILAKQVESAEVLSPHSIKFTFKDGIEKRDVIENVGGLPIFKAAWFEETGAILDESRLETPPGSGPYMRADMDVGRRLVYERNPDYWGADLPINKGRNNFDRIRIEYFGDQTAAFEAFKSGVVHFRNENSSKQWATGYDFPGVKNGTVVQAELPDGNIASGQAFVFNLRREKFQDIRVREAIGLMFNFEWSNETLFYGLYARVNSFWENSELQATGLPEGEELALLEPMRDILRPEVFDEEVPMAPVSGSRQLDRTNLRRASQLLDEAGWVVGNDGLRRNAQGQTLDVEFLERSPTFDRVILPYVDNLKKLGVNASLNRVDFPQFSERRQTFDYDIITSHLGGGYEPGDGLEQRWGSETAEVSIFNPTGFSSEATDRLIDIIKAAKTREELHVAVRALDRVLRVERIWVPEWYKDVHTIAYYDKYAYPEDLPPFDFGYLDFWWQDAEKEAKLKASGALK
ncbi:extracellular solute-binding protein [Halocynthiibacter sp. C4]|uniref:extracellular solute-binding protein n=1 Tax=Halocynthiibacter sp. C4 TaxID=2992758 RepID=UPI00237BA102|nr:extracellular solute-binding protein [Halocynthiibacter sp. C4]MDE0590699.1 extracellular solute-binding protein [Halocynthiibacter sp. C4]